MGGLYRIFLKLTPIMLLICCICYGILHTFQIAGQPNITYLTQETLNIGTEENPENKTIWKFDMVNYTQNIDQDILKRSIQHTVELDAYQYTLDQFNEIWQDGYQIFDVSKTIANGIVLLINTLILPINILLVPLRVISGLLLTGMSLIGININNGQVIIPMLKFFVDKFAIPFIQPQSTDPSPITNQQWQFYENINERWQGNQEIEVQFTLTQTSTVWDKIKIEQYNGSHVKMQYHSSAGIQGSWQIVFDSGRTGNAWAGSNNYQLYSNIQILANEGMTQEQANTITAFLQHYAQQIV